MGTQFFGGGGSQFEIDNSLVFDGAAHYLSNTFGAGDTKTWTFSTWVKLGTKGSNQVLFDSSVDVNNRTHITVDGNNRVQLLSIQASATTTQLSTEAQFRDYSAWYNVVVNYDSTPATPGNTDCRIWVNGVQITVWNVETYPTQDDLTEINAAQEHNIGRRVYDTGVLFGGYLAQTCFIDGQNLDPTSFGVTDGNGVWTPKDVSALTRGTNGFLLDFSDGTSTTTLGEDQGAGTNDWTLNSMAITDQVTDSPTNNVCVLNPLANSNLTLAEGNRDATGDGAAAWDMSNGTFAPSSGKWKVEFVSDVVSSDGRTILGLVPTDEAVAATSFPGLTTTSVGLQFPGGSVVRVLVNNAEESVMTDTHDLVATDVINMCWDVDSGKVWWGLNGTIFDSGDPDAGTGAHYTITSQALHPAIGLHTDDAVTAQFNSDEFTDGPSNATNFKALTTTNLPAPAIPDGSAGFQAHLDVGDTDDTHNVVFIGNSNLQPDLVWRKNIDAADPYTMFNSTDGVNVHLESQSGIGETVNDVLGYLTSFDSNGYTTAVGATSDDGVNTSGENYVSWNFKEGAAYGFGVNSDVSHTIGGETNVAHGLGAVPELVLLKRADDTLAWRNYHKDLTSQTDRYLDFGTISEATLVDFWGVHTSTNTIIGGAATGAPTGTYTVYSWVGVDGFSKFGVYEGNADVDGPFLYCGFKPAFFFWKGIDQTANWYAYDTARTPLNEMDEQLLLGSALAETTGSEEIDFLSNGVKIRSADPLQNGAFTYVWAAWAENPFGGVGVAPATAR